MTPVAERIDAGGAGDTAPSVSMAGADVGDVRYRPPNRARAAGLEWVLRSCLRHARPREAKVAARPHYEGPPIARLVRPDERRGKPCGIREPKRPVRI